MNPKNEICTISGNLIIDGKITVADLCALSSKTVGACDPNSPNSTQLKWEKNEENNQITLSSVSYSGAYVGVESIGGKCIATLSPNNKNLRFDVVQDRTSNEVFVKTTTESSKCFSSSDPKYLTMGNPSREGDIPVTFEPAMQGQEKSKQKWKFTKASSGSGS